MNQQYVTPNLSRLIKSYNHTTDIICIHIVHKSNMLHNSNITYSFISLDHAYLILCSPKDQQENNH